MLLTEEQEITKILDEMVSARENGDLDKYISYFSKKENYIHLGTAKIDHYFGREELRESLKSIATVRSRDLSPPQTYLKGNFAWVIRNMVWYAENAELKIEQRNRITIILEKEDEGWKIVHWHASANEIGIEEGQTIQTIAGIEQQIAEWITTFDLDPHLLAKIDASRFKSYLLQAQQILHKLQEK